MARMTGGEAVLRALMAHGIDTLFVLPGVQNDALFNALLRRRRPAPVDPDPRTSRAPPTWPSAMPRPSGRPGAYCVVPGPGLLNTTAALATAYASNAPVLCLSGQIPSHHIGRGFGLLARAARPARHHARPDQMGRADRRAAGCRPSGRRGVRPDAHGRPRPVALEMPMDVMAREAGSRADRSSCLPPPPPEPDPELIGAGRRAARTAPSSR